MRVVGGIVEAVVGLARVQWIWILSIRRDRSLATPATGNRSPAGRGLATAVLVAGILVAGILVVGGTAFRPRTVSARRLPPP